MGSQHPIAWVESPLQLVAAAEHAAATGVRPDVALRVDGPQMSSTARELLDRDAPFGRVVPYLGIPWSMLARSREWIVGDGFSGQFRLAAAVLRPRAIALLDDGAMSLDLAAAITGDGPFERPGTRPGAVRALLGDLTRDRLRGLAARGMLGFTSVYGAEDARFAALERLGVRLRRNRFDWTRASARPGALPTRHVVLGTARVADRLLDEHGHLAWISRRVAAAGPATYLPHRREDEAALAAVAALDDVTVLRTGLPVELVLAGMRGITVSARGTTASATLAAVLGPYATIRAEAPWAEVSAAAPRPLGGSPVASGRAAPRR